MFFGFWDVFSILRSVFVFWEVFFFGFWDVFWIVGNVLDPGKCFWIVGHVLDSGKCFVLTSHRNLGVFALPYIQCHQFTC